METTGFRWKETPKSSNLWISASVSNYDQKGLMLKSLKINKSVWYTEQLGNVQKEKEVESKEDRKEEGERGNLQRAREGMIQSSKPLGAQNSKRSQQRQRCKKGKNKKKREQ